MALALPLHLLFAILWVGGMFFAYQVLRPVAATSLEPPLRLGLWCGVFERFFPWVWAAIIVLPLSGYWMLFASQRGFATAGWHVHLMQLTGWVMIALFVYLYFGPWPALRQKFAAGELPAAAAALNRIRRIVAINLGLGLLTAAAAAAGRFTLG